MDYSNQVDRSTGKLSGWTSSPFGRIVIIGLLALLLQIPVIMISKVVKERSWFRDKSVSDITSKWGGKQNLVGPFLVIPYQWQDKSNNNKLRRSFAYFTPSQLNIDADAKTEIRYRGIYEVPLYAARATVNGEFDKPDFSQWSISEEDVLWQEARIEVYVSDIKGLQVPTAATWQGADILWQPGGSFTGKRSKISGIHALLKQADLSGSNRFEFSLALKGSKGVFFSPTGKNSVVDLHANWSNPSFQGAWLPSQRKINDNGFYASWSVPFIARGFPESWLASDSQQFRLSDNAVGVNFISKVDHYLKTERSVKYSLLFLCLTFVLIWLFEVLGGLTIHPIQYLMIGAALCLFYLLELSFLGYSIH